MIRFLLHLLGMVWRVIDVVVLAPRFALISVYVTIVRRSWSASPYTWPRAYRDVASVKRSGQTLDELVFGEVPIFVAVPLLLLAGVRRGSSVLDIGAGRGRLLLAARRIGAEARGIELVQSHVLAVARPLAQVGAQIDVGDALEADLDGVDCVFVNATGFEAATMARLAEHLSGLRPGAKVVAVTHPLTHDTLVRKWSFVAPFTWGVEVVRLYERA